MEPRLKACIDNRKKLVKWQYLLNMPSQYGELRPTSDWHRLMSLGHPSKFQRVSPLGFVTAPTPLKTARRFFVAKFHHFAISSAAINRGRHLYLLLLEWHCREYAAEALYIATLRLGQMTVICSMTAKQRQTMSQDWEQCCHDDERRWRPALNVSHNVRSIGVASFGVLGHVPLDF